MFLCNISYKTQAMLTKFGNPALAYLLTDLSTRPRRWRVCIVFLADRRCSDVYRRRRHTGGRCQRYPAVDGDLIKDLRRMLPCSI